MSLISRLSSAPIPYETEIGAETAALYDGAPAPMRALIEGTAGCSPFLATLLRREAEWLRAAWEQPPEEALADVMAALSAGDAGALEDALRQAKRRVALLIALADLGGVWELHRITGALSDFADRAVDLSLKALVGAEIRRGKIPGAGEDEIETAAGMCVLAMGKMGAGELNYSSDIDLICLFDETRYDPDDFHEVRAALIRATRRMCALLSDVTGEGYVFRTDLRLRPDPGVTPVCLSMEAAERYYESVGRTWERAAYIKARPCAGDIAAGEAFLDRLKPFVWRKHLDFAAIQDAHDMRLRIRSHKGLGGRLTLEGHDMKLGRGGIREIEFFTQTRQIIAGGRDPDLRLRGTVEGLAVLADKGWVPQEAAEALTEAYVAHRTVEHRVQMLGDAQTHKLPGSADGFDRLARFSGWDDTEAYRRDLRSRLEGVDTLIEGFFAPGQGEAAPEDAFSETAREIVSRWRSYPALRSSRAVEIFNRLKPVLLKRFARASRPDEALTQFDGFLSGLPAGVQIFSLFEANPQLVDLIADICATAPGLAAHLSRNAQVLDAVIAGDFFDPWPGADGLTEKLAAVLAPLDDYEAQLDAARRWMKERHFRVGVHHLRGLIGADEAAGQYSDLAEAVLRALWPVVCGAFAVRHGPPPGRGAAVLAMGSLGAGMLTAKSDLDLIVIYDARGATESEGRKPLSVTAYYAKLTQALVTALSARMAEGQLYEVDMRLRPSGRQGPVATALSAFTQYQQREAWTWEHLALTRARPVAGDDGLCAEIGEFRRTLLTARGDTEKIRQDTADMRKRISRAADARRVGNPWEPKLGRGRLQDIELVAQAAALIAGVPDRQPDAQLQAGADCGWIAEAQAAALAEAHGLLRRLNQGSRLLVEKPLDMEALGEGGRAFLLRETGAEDIASLRDTLGSQQMRCERLVDDILGAPRD
ncbi:bifunctional [glutamate--ammonia ligase]-adenylyl-L-tyrosine phosphorylase/[glutamate--ammonia-ligase] adenylyltransferase [Maritimibacter sp. 55A14]|uniref:bifunctional [glutamate--ammonia ligase]-adenylyl-L-tyrosine phosphorylase/[glutamate--ammonia-ligase] adenylyltransferase n=1 Tax=Maritimibacter sp. 55A14 TaxID=2174844 RepID=UPI000D61DA07|nr:bifunctional [glutamate--ammonia ligase]-adenylyl-L-tyrosine phosphorylase/[glutamate--ammonia-ligase] adenylyltransferase [Maritimibacter sp. 55A14]PWE34285.1 bifunctional [glutamate--ammonia ligase]-adenylyl-L-tyrosine phosphorylase/[glutamate--ammonia-ligase] adenylyltransferase [Maritimibacter sp. 55A14]